MWKKYNVNDGILSNLIYSMVLDKRGNLWFGCKNPNGVTRFNGDKFENFTATNSGIGLCHIWDMVVDAEENIWFATAGDGLRKLNGKKWNTYTIKEGLAGNYIYAVEVDQDGKLWCGCAPKPDLIVQEGGISVFDGQKFTNYTSNYTQGRYIGGGNSGLCDNRVYSIAFDKKGNIWFGTKGNGVCRYNGQSWITFNRNNGFPNNEVGDGAIEMDKKGNIWIGTRGSGVCRFDGDNFRIYTMEDGLAGNFVYAIKNGPDGKLWIGCSPDPDKINREGGLSVFDGFSFLNYKSDYSGGKYIGGGNSPLADNRVYSIVFDSDGNGWFGTKGGGISRLSHRAITI
jgi:ligand-binding sensor domain-containing protein